MLIKIYNKDIIESRFKTNLSANVASGSNIVSVSNFSGFLNNDYILIGNFGEPTAEIRQISDTSIDETVELSSSLKNDHFSDTPVTIIPYDKAQFFYSTTSDDTSPAQLGGNIDIQAYDEYTIYEDLTHTSGYGYTRFYNTETTEDSGYSKAINYTGRAYNTVGEILKDAYESLGLKLGDKYVEKSVLFTDINEAQNKITDYRDWSFELVKDDTTIVSEENENKYSISALNLKYPDSIEGILSVKIGSNVLKFMDIDEYEKSMNNIVRTNVSSAITALDTTIILDDTYEFADKGTITIGEDNITYTGNTKITGTLTGCTGVDNNHDVDDTVWQNINSGLPTKYTIFDGYIYLNYPVSTNYAGYKIKFKYLKKLDRLTSMEDIVKIPFCSILSSYVKYKIETRRKNFKIADVYLKEFWDYISINKGKYKLPVLEEGTYYNI